MSVENVPVTSQVTKTSVDVSVTAAYDSAGGTSVANTTKSTHVVVHNKSDFEVEYKVDSGSWVPLRYHTNVRLDIDMSAQTLALRRGEVIAPSPATCVVDVYEPPVGLKAEGGDGAAEAASSVQSLAYSATRSVNHASGLEVIVGTLTGNVQIDVPTGIPARGVMVAYHFTQDGTGTRTLTWSASHKGSAPTAAGTAGQKQSVFFRSDGTNLIYAGASGWY